MIEWIKELRSTERGRTLFKFILYMIFFVIVFLLILIVSRTSEPYIEGNNSKNSTTTVIESTGKKTYTYLDKQNKLIHGKYDFVYNVSGAKEVIYMGTYNDGEVDALRETSDEVIRYSIESGKVYLKKLSSKEEYTLLYDGVNSELFDIENLFNKINMASATIDNTLENKTYNYEDVEGKKIQVITNDEEIIEINIWEGEFIYKFTYE